MKALVLGAGSIGGRHLANLLAEGVRDIIVYDPDPDVRERVGQEFGVSIVESDEAALAGEADIVFICTPTHLHLSLARAFLDRGAHLFIEKPLADRWDGVPEFVEAVRQSNRVVVVGYNMRFHPAVRRIHEELRCGEIGVPWVLHARFGHYLPNWRPGQDYRMTYSAQKAQGGGVLMDGIHEVDYLLWWGGEVRQIWPLAASISDLQIDTEDYAVVFFQFASGAVGQVQLDYLRHEKLRKTEVIGSKGMLLWESVGKAPEHVVLRRFDAKSRVYQTLVDLPAYDINETYLAELKHFLRAVRGEELPQWTLAEATESLRTVLSAKHKILTAERMKA